MLKHANEKFPQVPKVQFAGPMDQAFHLQSLTDGVRAVLPKPQKEGQKETFIEDTKKFLTTFLSYIKAILDEQNRQLSQHSPAADDQIEKLRNHISALGDLDEYPDVSFALLNYVSQTFERTIFFLARETYLICVKDLGVGNSENGTKTSAIGLRIPLTEPSLLRNVTEEGNIFYGESDDEVIKKYLLEGIGHPHSPKTLLLPMKSCGKTISLIYGDFGRKAAPSDAPIDTLKNLSNQASLVLDLIKSFFSKNAAH